MAWTFLSLPVITSPAATVALMLTVHRLRTGPSLEFEWDEFWSDFRRYFGRATGFGLICAAVIGLAAYNRLAYSGEHGALIAILRVIWVTAIFVCSGVMLYTWPLYIRQSDRRMVTAVRNALVMTLANPVFTLTLLMGITAVAAISTVLIVPWGLLTVSWVSAVAEEAVDDRLIISR